MPLFQGFCPVAGTICPSLAAAVVGPSRAPQGMKKGRRPRRRPRLKLSDKAGPDQCPVPGENALFPAQIAGFLAVSRAVPVYPVFLNYVVPVHPGQIRPGAACVKGVSGTSLSMISCGLSAFTHLLAVRAYKRAHVPSCSYGVSFASTYAIFTVQCLTGALPGRVVYTPALSPAVPIAQTRK